VAEQHFHARRDVHAPRDRIAQLLRAGRRVAVDVDARERRRELAPQPVGQRVGILHRVELHHAVGRRHRVRLEREDLRSHEIFGLHSSLISAARWWADKPSPSASTAAIFPSFCAPARETPITLVRFWKSYTPSGEEKRAVPAVGSTWFGPAQ